VMAHIGFVLLSLSDSDWSVRQAAVTVLGQLGSGREDVVEALLKALSDSFPDVRQAATDALTILQIDRQAVGQQIKGYLLSQEPIVSKQYEADDTIDALLFALQQIIGEA